METRSASRRSVRLVKVKPPRPRRTVSEPEPAPIEEDPNVKIIESLQSKLIQEAASHTDVLEFVHHVDTCGQQVELLPKGVKVKPPRPRRTVSEPEPAPIEVTRSPPPPPCWSTEDPNVKIIESLQSKLIQEAASHTDVLEFVHHVDTCGQQMELLAKGHLDELFDVIRSSMMASHMEALTRMHLLQLLELRAAGWQTDETRSNFYKHKCRGLAVKERSHSEVCENNNKITPKVTRQTSEPVTLDKTADDALTHRKMSIGEPQSDIVPSRPYLDRCTSVPTDGDSGSRLSRFRSDRCFSQGVAPSPWSCGSSTLELSHMGSNMRAGTCSTSPDPDPGSPLSEDVFLDAVSVTQEHSTSDVGNKWTDGETTHNKAAGDALPRVGMSAEHKLSDTATHGMRSAVNGAGDPQSNSFASPPPGLQRCASVPADGDSGGFSRFRSLSDRRFSQDVAPSPWGCGSSIRELSHVDSNMRADTCSTSLDSGFGQGCLTFKREVLLSFSVSPLTREPPQDWSYLSKVFPEVCLTKVDNYFDMSAYSLPIYHSRKDADDSWKSVVRTGGFPGFTKPTVGGGFPIFTKKDIDNSTKIVSGGFPGFTKQDSDLSPKIVGGGFPGFTKQDIDVASAVVKGAFPDFIKQEPDISPPVINGFTGVVKQGIIDVSTRVE